MCSANENDRWNEMSVFTLLHLQATWWFYTLMQFLTCSKFCFFLLNLHWQARQQLRPKPVICPWDGTHCEHFLKEEVVSVQGHGTIAVQWTDNCHKTETMFQGWDLQFRIDSEPLYSICHQWTYFSHVKPNLLPSRLRLGKSPQFLANSDKRNHRKHLQNEQFVDLLIYS